MLTVAVVWILAVAGCPSGHDCATFKGHLRRGEHFSSSFGPGLALALEPREYGWEILVRDERPQENIARLTPPLHFVPNPRYIEGWHFRNASNTGPNDGSINAPQLKRDFVFSPDVGRSIDYPPSAEQVKPVDHAGRGRLIIRSLELTSPSPGEKAALEKIGFIVDLWWPSSWEKKAPK